MARYEVMMMGSVSVVCPKPRRLSVNHQPDLGDSTTGAKLLDLIRTKGGYDVASSPPFYCGSPPCRVSNPIIEDAHFGNAMILPFYEPVSSPSASPRKGTGSKKFGHKPASVRIEGFDCHTRVRRSGGISAMMQHF